MKINKLAVIGSGAWGTALAQNAIDAGVKKVTIYGIIKSEVDDINNGFNQKFFGKRKLVEGIKSTTDIKEALKDVDAVLFVVPSIAILSALKSVDDALDHNVIYINAIKGFHPHSNEILSEVFKKNNSKWMSSYVTLMGPSHAEEVIKRSLTSICAVSKDIQMANVVRNSFSNDYMRIYSKTDVVGTEIAAALKNTIAIASGMIEELGLGINTKAALITRGLSEIRRFGKVFGGKEKTFIGLTGVGDLIVTCFSNHSRNFTFGRQVIIAGSAQKAIADNTKTVEGYRTCKCVVEIAKKHNIDMPIFMAMYNILFKNSDYKIELKKLMQRPYKQEI